MLRRAFVAAALAGLLAACSGGSKDEAGAPPKIGVQGAGATFPAPLYARWATAYGTQAAVQINYQPIGSGGGINQIKQGTVDFGATDKPLTGEELTAAGLIQFPTVLGGVVPVINIPGVAPGQLKLTGPLLADIFRGDLTRWSDPRVAAVNEGLVLPDLPITVVHRSDGSGTTYLFTTYLAGVSPAFKASPGASDALAWPVGIGGKGNDGIAAYVKQTPGSIGYVEYSYVKQNGLGFAQVQNREGAFVTPTAETFVAAAQGVDWSKVPGFALLLLNQPGATAWPITGATFILLRKDGAKNPEIAKFFEWGLATGDFAATELGYVPLPAPVKELVRAAWVADTKPIAAAK